MPIRTFGHWMNLTAEEIDLLADVGRRYNYTVQDNDVDETKRSSAILYDIARKLLEDRKRNPLPVDEDVTSAVNDVDVSVQYSASYLPPRIDLQEAGGEPRQLVMV